MGRFTLALNFLQFGGVLKAPGNGKDGNVQFHRQENMGHIADW